MRIPFVKECLTNILILLQSLALSLTSFVEIYIRIIYLDIYETGKKYVGFIFSAWHLSLYFLRIYRASCEFFINPKSVVQIPVVIIFFVSIEF